MKNRIWMFGGCLLLLWLATGCIGVDYSGQRFAALPADTSIPVFGPDADYPATDFRVLGRAVFTAPDGYSSVELNGKLESTAREYGAEAVKIVSSERQLASAAYRQPDDERPLSSLSRGNTGRRAGGEPIYVDTFGEEVSISPERIERYEVVVRTLMLVRRERYDRIMAERERQRGPVTSPVAAEPDEAPAAAPAAPPSEPLSAEPSAAPSAEPVAVPAEKPAEGSASGR